MNRTRTAVLILAVTALVARCGGAPPIQEEEEAMTVTLNSLDDVTPAQWEVLAARRIFFGHQSVGRNMLAGMRLVLEENPAIDLVLANSDDPSTVEGPALIEANIGRNGEPATKADAFASVLESGFGREPGAVAMFKFCYVDMRPEADPDEMFEDYVRRTTALKARFPDITLVHITIPLVVTPEGIGEALRNRLGRDTQTRVNLKRNRFNDRMRETYGGTEPLFDLALIESLESGGSRSYTRFRGEKVYRMAPEWTSDGGHLNEAGQRHVAEQFLAFLATLADPSGSPRVADGSNTSTGMSR